MIKISTSGVTYLPRCDNLGKQVPIIFTHFLLPIWNLTYIFKIWYTKNQQFIYDGYNNDDR